MIADLNAISVCHHARNNAPYTWFTADKGHESRKNTADQHTTDGLGSSQTICKVTGPKSPGSRVDSSRNPIPSSERLVSEISCMKRQYGPISEKCFGRVYLLLLRHGNDVVVRPPRVLAFHSPRRKCLGDTRPWNLYGRHDVFDWLQVRGRSVQSTATDCGKSKSQIPKTEIGRAPYMNCLGKAACGRRYCDYGVGVDGEPYSSLPQRQS